jgi:hypothetical protein
MDYQEHILTLLRGEVERFKLSSVTDMETETRGRLLVMKKWEVVGSLHFDFGPLVTVMSLGAPMLMITGGRGNRQFQWSVQDPDDANEEVVRLAKIWHLVLKEQADAQPKAA